MGNIKPPTDLKSAGGCYFEHHYKSRQATRGFLPAAFLFVEQLFGHLGNVFTGDLKLLDQLPRLT